MISQIFNVAIKYGLLVSYKILDTFEEIVSTAVPNAGSSNGKWNENGEPQSPKHDDLNEMKRIKLLLDISVTPGPKGVVVSHTKVTNIPVTASLFSRLFWLPAFCLITGSQTARKILKLLEKFVKEDLCDNGFLKIDDNSRKMISPRKRLRRSRSWRSVLPNFFPFSLLKRGSRAVFEIPLMELPDNDESSNARLKSVEKRKRSSSGSDSDTTSNISSLPTSSNKVRQNGHRSSSDVESEDHVKEKVGEQHTSGTNSCVRRLTSKDLFDVDDDYKSADDPDYCPSDEDSSTTSSAGHDSEDELENNYSDAENNEGVISPATSTTDMFPADETNRNVQDSDSNPLSSPFSDTSFTLPLSASTFDSPHSTTSYEDN